jgi:dihydropteroate synthase
MGILNVTPDSFSDGGRFFETESAVSRGVSLEREGADLLDVGGESTRPGSEPVSEDEECHRVIPVIKGLAKRIRLPISVDTCKARVAEESFQAGATWLNDVSALRFDPRMAAVAAKYDVPVVLMHMKGIPRDMQRDPVYRDVVAEVHAFFEERIAFATRSGIRRERIVLDPGIGFGKRLEHNLALIRHLERFHDLGCPILVGPSRKGFLGEILGLPLGERLEGTAAVVAVAAMKGADIVRVHDVQAMLRVTRVVDAIRGDLNRSWTS